MGNQNHRWTALLGDSSFVVLDGGLATELETAGANLDHPLWSGQILRTQPELIQQCHQAYFDAGAQVATTASYQLTTEGMRRAGLNPDEFGNLLELSVVLARRAAGKEGIVAGSIGPYGAMLNDGSEYTGNYAQDAALLKQFHTPRLEGLTASGADVIALETFPSLFEATIAIETLDQLTDVPCWVSFTCRDGEHTAYGEPLADCASQMQDMARVTAIGVNCVSPEIAIQATRTLAESSALPLIAYPNSGERYDAAHGCWEDQRSTMTATEVAQSLADAGARIIGGCCRTSPAWITEARAALARA